MNFLKPHRWTGHEASDHQLGIDILNRWMPARVGIKLVCLGGYDGHAQPQSEHHEQTCNSQVH